MYINHNCVLKGEESPLSGSGRVVEEQTAMSPRAMATYNHENAFVTPASMTNGGANFDFDDEIKFPPMMPPASPQYWGDVDGGASEASMSRSCSPLYTPPTEFNDPALGSLLPPKIVNTDELLPAIRPLYDHYEPVDSPFDSPFESESSDVNMDDDFINSLYALRRSCFNCRVYGVTCSKCNYGENEKEAFSPLRLTDKDMDNELIHPSKLFNGKPFMDPETFPAFPNVDFLRDDDEEMMDVEVKFEDDDDNDLWTSNFPTLDL